jgi:hypothetical protein
MQNSTLNTLTVPGAAAGNPATLFKASNTPIRIAVTNVGGSTVFLAHDTPSLINQPVQTNTYLLQSGAGVQVVILLAPQQGLYAVAQGAGGLVSIAVSEALPVA